MSYADLESRRAFASVQGKILDQYDSADDGLREAMRFLGLGNIIDIRFTPISHRPVLPVSKVEVGMTTLEALTQTGNDYLAIFADPDNT